MPYPKLPPWPFIDPDNLPFDYLRVGESIDRHHVPELPQTWHFFVVSGYLIVIKKEWIQLEQSDPGEYVIRQYEYPITGVRWFIDTVERFFLHPDHPNAVPRGEITIEEPVGNEVLGVTRGAAYGGDFTPGYSFDNLNRIEHSTIMPEGPFCEMFKMGDPWLFEDGLFDLFREIAERHERGEF